MKKFLKRRYPVILIALICFVGLSPVVHYFINGMSMGEDYNWGREAAMNALIGLFLGLVLPLKSEKKETEE